VSIHQLRDASCFEVAVVGCDELQEEPALTIDEVDVPEWRIEDILQ